jgi:hypothetical protein
MTLGKMKTLSAALLLAAVCGWGASADAQEMYAQPARAELPSGLEIGAEMYYYKYEEPNFAELEGLFYGLSTNYTFRNFTIPLMVRGEADLAWGVLDYSSNGTGTADSNDNFVVEPRLLVGYDLAAWGGTVTPFFGVGYRYLENNMGGTISTTGAGGYDRISQYVYSPVGFEWFMPLQGEWTGVYALEFDIFWDGTQKSELSDVAVGLSDLTNDQNDGFGFRSSLRFAGQALGYSIEIEPFFRYWLVRDSDVSPIRYQGVAVGYGLEPENQTFEAGAKILLKY